MKNILYNSWTLLFQSVFFPQNLTVNTHFLIFNSSLPYAFICRPLTIPSTHHSCYTDFLWCNAQVEKVLSFRINMEKNRFLFTRGKRVFTYNFTM